MGRRPTQRCAAGNDSDTERNPAVESMLLTVTEAAARVGRSRTWFYAYALPHVESRWIGARRYVVAASLDEWIRRNN